VIPVIAEIAFANAAQARVHALPCDWILQPPSSLAEGDSTGLRRVLANFNVDNWNRHEV
jgi:hypothetical protein